MYIKYYDRLKMVSEWINVYKDENKREREREYMSAWGLMWMDVWKYIMTMMFWPTAWIILSCKSILHIHYRYSRVTHKEECISVGLLDVSSDFSVVYYKSPLWLKKLWLKPLSRLWNYELNVTIWFYLQKFLQVFLWLWCRDVEQPVPVAGRANSRYRYPLWLCCSYRITVAHGGGLTTAQKTI